MHFLNALSDFYCFKILMPMMKSAINRSVNHRFHHRNLDNLKLVSQEGKKEDLNKKARARFKCRRV